MPLIAWCVERKGPLYVTVFSPVRLVIVALAGSFALEETLHLGRYTKTRVTIKLINVFVYECMIYVNLIRFYIWRNLTV